MENTTPDILLIEDNPADQELFKEIISETAFASSAIVVCERMAQVVEKLKDKSHRYDVICLDLNLPDSNGVETFKRVQQMANGVPVIVYTSVKDTKLATECIRMGAEDYYEKDNLDPWQLEKTFRNTLIRSRLSDDIKQSLKKLKRVNGNLRQYAYVASHDIKSPVGNLIGLLSLYDKSYQNIERNKTVFSKIEITVEQLDNTVKLLLKALHSQHNPEEAHCENMIEDIYDKVKAILQPQIDEAQATIILDTCKECESIYLSPMQAHSLFQNLISNAIKYRSPDRLPVVTIAAKDFEHYVELTFTDNGRGINLDIHHERLFSLFTQFHSGVEGNGIGLYTVKSIVESVDGELEVESEVDEGTTFRLKIPKEVRSKKSSHQKASF